MCDTDSSDAWKRYTVALSNLFLLWPALQVLYVGYRRRTFPGERERLSVLSGLSVFAFLVFFFAYFFSQFYHLCDNNELNDDPSGADVHCHRFCLLEYDILRHLDIVFSVLIIPTVALHGFGWKLFRKKQKQGGGVEFTPLVPSTNADTAVAPLALFYAPLYIIFIVGTLVFTFGAIASGPNSLERHVPETIGGAIAVFALLVRIRIEWAYESELVDSDDAKERLVWLNRIHFKAALWPQIIPGIATGVIAAIFMFRPGKLSDTRKDYWIYHSLWHVLASATIAIWISFLDVVPSSVRGYRRLLWWRDAYVVGETSSKNKEKQQPTRNNLILNLAVHTHLPSAAASE